LPSDPPTYLSKISGPAIILGSLAINVFDICLAISVLPQPGGPYNSIPFICSIPNFSKTECGYILDVNTLLNIFLNSLSKPPMPNSSKLKFVLNRSFCACWSAFILKFCDTVVQLTVVVITFDFIITPEFS